MQDALPSFVRDSHIKDKNGKRPSEQDYDPCTLMIPQAMWPTFTPAMRQYWEIKSNNNEKILFFKLGKFYEIFYNDALICHRLLDLNFMGGAKSGKLHCGFPEAALDKYVVVLVNAGYKVAVIE